MKFYILGVLIDIQTSNKRICDFLNSKLGYFKTETSFFKKYTFVQIDERSEKFFRINRRILKKLNTNLLNYEENGTIYFCDYKTNIMRLSIEFVIMENIIYILSLNGIFYLHGSCISLNNESDNGVIITGNPGAGKTTLALKMLEMDEKTTGDDFLLLRYCDNIIKSYKNPVMPRIELKNCKDNFKYLENYLNEGDGKWSININEFYKKNVFIDSIKPKTILIIDDEKSDKDIIIEHITTINAFKLLSMQIYISDNFKLDMYYSFLYDLLMQCNAYYIKLGKNYDKNVLSLYEFINNGNKATD